MRMLHNKLNIWVEVFPKVIDGKLTYVSDNGSLFSPEELEYPKTASVGHTNVQAIPFTIKPQINGSLTVKKQK